MLELLFHFTAKFAPQGNIGRWTNDQIASGMRWPGDPDLLVRGLVEGGWLDEDKKLRLVVHDWSEHADDSVKKRLIRSGLKFVKEMPNGTDRFETPATPRIYFIRATKSGLIKIGHTEWPVESRMGSLQVGCPEPLELLGSYVAQRSEEHKLHKRFAQFRETGEWFRPSDELLSLIESKAKVKAARPTTAAVGGTAAYNGRLPSQSLASAKPEPSQSLSARPLRAAFPSDRAADVFLKHYPQGKPPGAMFRELRPLVLKHGWERVEPELDAYLASTEVQYHNWTKFASGFGTWTNPKKGSVGDKAMSEAAAFLSERQE